MDPVLFCDCSDKLNVEDDESEADENSPDHIHHEDFYDDILNDYDIYGSTPTRTRIARKTKERKQREKERGVQKTQLSKMMKVKASSTDKALALPMDVDGGESSSDETDSQMTAESSKSKKRSLKLLRDSERDFKLDFSDVNHSSGDSTETKREKPDDGTAPTFKVETCKPFMCLSSKLVSSRKPGQNTPYNFSSSVKPDRATFFQSLVRYCNHEKLYGQEHVNKQLMDTEEHSEKNVWQSELKDLLWLELRAYISDRTPSEQDQYFCKERERVGDLLKHIMDFTLDYSLIEEASDEPPHDSCWCCEMFCSVCHERINVALRRVEALLIKLENAVALYPSSRTFGLHYPLYFSSEFTAKVKAMCLWYNVTKHMRLKFLILCRHLIQAEEPDFPNPKQLMISGSVDSHGSSISTSNNSDPSTSNHSEPSTSNHSEPSTSNNSDETTVDEDYEYNSSTGLYCYRIGEKKYEMDYYNMIPDLSQYFETDRSTDASTINVEHRPMLCTSYRKYIKTNLKTKGVKRAFNFIEKLESTVLRKIKWSLMGLNEEEKQQLASFDKSCDISEELELKRYGAWSEEARLLGLPAYRASFVFLTRIPLDVVHTFLLMRLITRPEKPSLMSIRQLIYELKEGLRLSALVRSQYLDHFETAFKGAPADQKIDSDISSFDQTTQNVLEVYLEYLYQWVTMIQQEQVQKNVLEEEWIFAKNVSPHIPGGQALVGSRFCLVACTIFKAVDSHLSKGVEDLINHLEKANQSEIKHEMFRVCRGLQYLCTVTREKALRSIVIVKILRKDLENSDQENTQFSLYYNVIMDALVQLKKETVVFCATIKEVIATVESACFIPDSLDEIENCALQSRIREVLNQFYKFAFEYFKEVYRLMQNYLHDQFSECMIGLANQWISFVKNKCERGRGLKPKWATQGLDFLLTACDPQITNYLPDDKFKSFKLAVEDIIDYIVGSQENTIPDICSKLFQTSPRSQPSTPPVFSLNHSGTPRFRRRCDASQNSIHNHEKRLSSEGCESSASEMNFEPLSYRSRVHSAVKSLDNAIEKRLRQESRIGEVCETYSNTLNIQRYVKYHTISFSWQRGIKIGQGRFGKVYTIVNHETGELLAMKELQLQPNDHQAVMRVVQELNLFERISHENLVRYYGVEIHKEEMLIFMELCPEGCLENFVASIEGGLPESIIRSYMRQLVSGVACLHQHGIVHRDIKTANIFLTKEGKCLKLGDFGSAAKMKAHLTVPGELVGFVGTQAYMAPEVFMKSNTVGHGRAVDIWSLGCVLVELASGERPWAEYDSNYQIMFKVGMGESPSVPEVLSDEGHAFANLCLQHDPKERATISDLSHHLFLKIDGEEEIPVSFIKG